MGQRTVALRLQVGFVALLAGCAGQLPGVPGFEAITETAKGGCCMPARNPEELLRSFSDALNSGDLDALVALYEPQATLSPEPGQIVTGTEAIRKALSSFVAIKPTIALEVKTLARTRDIALTSTRWELSGTGSDGNQIKMGGHSVEVSRRQPDGSWLFVIDIPSGLGWGG